MLIPSKLSRPVRLDHTVVRERLLAKLSGANNFRLALITSPAGYGKTTLISQWAAGKNDIGWYSLDEGDNQQERFASYLIAAVQQATNGHCAICETMAQKRQYASLTSLFAQLFIELAEWHSPLYLVIQKISPWWCCHATFRNWALPICVFVINCWKLAVSNWHLPIRKRSSFLIAVCHRRLKLQKAVGFAMTFPVGRRHYS